MEKIKLGISIGDPNGIGGEVLLKTLADKRILNYCTPIVYATPAIIAQNRSAIGSAVQEVALKEIDNSAAVSEAGVYLVTLPFPDFKVEWGKESKESGTLAYTALKQAVEDLKAGHIQGLVTAPIHKNVMQQSGFPFPGHTEYLMQELGGREALMLMVAGQLRVGLVTGHVPLKDVASSLTQAGVLKKLMILDQTIRTDFGIDRPLLAVLGLNPHAGDLGTLGQEELNIIRPAMKEAQQAGLMVFGPFSADGFFAAKQHQRFDGVLAMYHDQGLIPFKTLAFSEGVNYTAGLSHVRTSPDHGTAFDIAGKNLAEPDSFRQALFLATDIVRQRINYKEMRANRLKNRYIAKSDDETIPQH